MGARLLSLFRGLKPSQETRTVFRMWATRAALVALVVGATLGSLEIQHRVEGDPRYYLENWTVHTDQLPAWVTPEIRQQLETIDLGAGGPRLSLFRPGVFKELRARLQALPWIEEVSDIRLRYPVLDKQGVMDLQLRLRTPVALVEHAGLYYLADSEAMRMGEPYREAPVAWFRVPAIVRIPDPGPLPEPGQRWTSRDVLQGIEVAKVLFQHSIQREFPSRLIESIDLSNLHGVRNPRDSEIVLWVEGRNLAWGRSRISDGARTYPEEVILRNLREFLSRPEIARDVAKIYLDRDPGYLIGSRG
jgi:hypothetical protein